jgi:nucleotide-binding universal stress UspA family protein
MKDLAVFLDCYPDPANGPTVDRAAAVCAALGGVATGVALELDMWTGDFDLGEAVVAVEAIAEREQARQARQAAAALARFRRAARRLGAYGDSRLVKTTMAASLQDLAQAMRYHDLCVLPGGGERERSVAEAVLFGSGRPVVIFDPQATAPLTRLDHVVVGWDGGRAAARAVADGLPLLKAARTVSLVTVADDASADDANALARHLARHEIEARAVALPGDPVARLLETARQADLLLMGAYGHSRLREAVLGGVTRRVLCKPPTTVLLSH